MAKAFQDRQFHSGRELLSDRQRSAQIVKVDALLKQVTSGPTEQRPVTPKVGFNYFDTTLGRPVHYNGSIWVFSDGSAA